MKNKLAASALKAAVIYIIVTVVMIIAAEFIAPFKNFLASLTGHHWTAKGVIGVVIFLFFTLLFNAKGSDDDVGKNIGIVIICSVTGAVILTLFFFIHYIA